MKKTGMTLIRQERERQMQVEGWTARHDDRHDRQQLSRAAESYFLSAGMTTQGFKSFRPPDSWPWAKKWWKPSTPIRDLTKAGALWLAELDRMQRLNGNSAILKILLNRVDNCADKIDAIQS